MKEPLFSSYSLRPGDVLARTDFQQVFDVLSASLGPSVWVSLAKVFRQDGRLVVTFRGDTAPFEPSTVDDIEALWSLRAA